MAVYTNLEATNAGKHGMFESSKIKSAIAGNIYDAIVRDGASKEIAVDNGAPVAIGAYTGDGLQTRYATIATTADVVAVVGSPAIVKEAMTNGQAQDYNFEVKAGQPARVYALEAEDVFAVADYQITKSSALAVGDTVVVDGKGAYKVATSTTTEKFVAKIHSISAGSYVTMVRLEVVKNA